MSRGRIAAASVLAAAVAAIAVAVVATRDDADSAGRDVPIRVQGTLTPRILLFGDTLIARIDVTLDRRQIDPDSVRFHADFTPWEVVGKPRLERRDGGRTTLVRTTWVLRCLIGPCVPPRALAPLEFDPAQITYGGGEATRLRWPVLYVHSRLPAGDLDRAGSASHPWRVDLISLPEPSYRVAPRLLVALLLAAAGLLVLAGAFFAYRALPERREAPPPPPEPPPPPPSVLEQALALLEDPAPDDGVADRRRALELIADELEARDARLAGTARALAWREEMPPPVETIALAANVREVLGEDNGADAVA
jgi:hypothetical protein